MTKYPHTLSRKEFLKLTGLGLTASFLSSGLSFGASARQGRLIAPDKKLRVACVGCGGRGASDITEIGAEHIVALCDVDPARAKKTFLKYPDAPKYTDFRVMLKEMDDQIDAVLVSTPDHTHFVVAMAAIQMGKHVLVQKPLTTSVWEARELQRAAQKHGVVTNMYNQGHTGEGCRLAKEWFEAGLIGDVTEVHVWTDKLTDGAYRSSIRGEMYPAQEVPDSLDWNQWLGPIPELPYSDEVAPFRWRGWWPFGNGALGDIGCHTMDAAFFALNLRQPIAITAETSGYNRFTFPDWSIITYEFPARGQMPPCKLVWYDGGKLPEAPAGITNLNKRRGYFMVGSDGGIYDPSEKCSSPRIYPETKRRELRNLMPAKTIPRAEGANPAEEFALACKGGATPGSNFNYSAPLTEMVLLGNLAIRADGKRIEWDAENMEVTNMQDLNTYLKPPPLRSY
jgi:predicted dehydrogenase